MRLMMLPLMPELSQRSGAIKALWDSGLSGVATVATTFNNLNKKNGFRKNFSILCGNAGNKANLVYIGYRINKKSYRRLALLVSVNKAAYFFSHEISLVMRATSALFAASSAVITRDQTHA